MFRRNRWLQKTLALSVILPLASAVVPGLRTSAVAGETGLSASAGVMAMMNAFEQGGSGPKGSTFLSQSEINYHLNWTGLGFFFQYDKQGANQTDTAFGPKFELHKSVFYIELGYALAVKRAFTDRSIAEQTGNGWLMGFGTRFMLGGGRGGRRAGGSSGLFLQFSYKYRIQNVTEQDGVKLSEPIRQTDGYPLFGLGYQF